MIATILLLAAAAKDESFSSAYVIGLILAVCLLGYLLFSLIKPEKF